MTLQFTYIQNEYHELKEHSRRLGWKTEEKNYIYDNCIIDVIGMDKNRARIVVRRKIIGHSSFAAKIKKNPNFTLNLMMGFVTTQASKSENQFGESIISFEIEQSNDKVHRDLKNVKLISDNKDEIESLLNLIQQKMGNSSNITNIIDSVYFDKSSEIMPVVYQPEVDASKNILRDIQVSKKNSSHEVTLVFDGEILRKHGLLDPIYKLFRYFRYRRTVDIESFKIKGNELVFDHIYSGDNTLFNDTIHESKKVNTKYYFQDSNHPVVFVNTSNHALSESDNNHDFWKREYVAWSDKVPIKYGNKTNEKTKKEYEEF